jgi:type II secretory pathway component PulF
MAADEVAHAGRDLTPRRRRDRTAQRPIEAGRRPAGRPDAILGRRRRGRRDVRPLTRSRANGRNTEDGLRLLAELVEAGVPLERAIGTLERAGASESSRARATALRSHVRVGVPVSQALQESGASPAVVALLRGAEHAGCIGEGLDRAADLVESLQRMRREIRTAMVYPAVIAALGLLIVIVIAVGVLPQFERSFAALDAELPRPTRILLGFGGLLRRLGTPGGIATSLAGISVIGIVFRARSHSRTSAASPRMRPGAQSMTGPPFRLDRVPMIGRLRIGIDVATAARVIAMMLSGGAAETDALRVARDGSTTKVVRSQLDRAHTLLVAGDTPASTAALAKILTPGEVEMLAIGRDAGLVARQWQHIASRRAQGLQHELARLAGLTEPVMVVLVGLTVGAAVSALYLPTFRILEAI